MSVTLNIKGLTTDSRQVQPGYLFAAVSKRYGDNCTHIRDAITRGAVAVLALPGTRLESADVCLIEDANPRLCFTEMAAAFYGYQPKAIMAVTGTNGKTSVVTFVRQLLTRLGVATASIGTLGVTAPGVALPSRLTTPDAAILHRVLADLANRSIECVALEASSHGLDQFRLDGVQITAAAFTNLTRDHLDYHSSMSSYQAAKLRLFAELLPRDAAAILNADDPAFPIFRKAALARGARVFSYGLTGTDYHLVAITPTGSGQNIDLRLHDRHFTVHLPLVGLFQAMNALCALGLVIDSGAEIKTAIAALTTLDSVPGRLQQAAMRHNGASVYVDYAHTPDALKTVLTALRFHGCNRLTVVFGCGGNRDSGKRPQMGNVAALLADYVIITDDNPRSEIPEIIRAEIRAGCPGAYDIGDRALAIQTAVAALQTGDVLLVAGKGHEQEQISNTVSPFDDITACQYAVALADRADSAVETAIGENI